MNEAYFCQESVYDFIHPPTIPPARPPRYVSIYSDKVKQMYNEVKQNHRTMGCVRTSLREPNNYMRKHHRECSGVECKNRPKIIEYSNKIDRKPAVPKHCDLQKKELFLSPDQCINFINENARHVIRSRAPGFKPRIIDSKRGNSIDLEESGLVPKYIHKPGYGKIPRYLATTKSILEKSQKMQRDWEKAEKEKAYTRITEEEKNEILKGLDKKHQLLTKSYLTDLPLLIETIGQKRKKVMLEHELQKIEKDILLLTEKRDIFIQN